MKPMGIAAAVLVCNLVSAACAAAATSPTALYDRAKRAIAAGNVVPERDLAPLVDVLRAPASTDDLRTAIDKIETLGSASGSSPAAVKHYLLEQSTPLLLKIGATGPTVFARGDAVMALRDMGASRAVLDQAATIAEKDRDDYVRSRGEILRNFMKSMPAGGAAAEVKPLAARERAGDRAAEDDATLACPRTSCGARRSKATPPMSRRSSTPASTSTAARRLGDSATLLRGVLGLRREAGRDRRPGQHRQRSARRRRRRQAQGRQRQQHPDERRANVRAEEIVTR